MKVAIEVTQNLNRNCASIKRYANAICVQQNLFSVFKSYVTKIRGIQLGLSVQFKRLSCHLSLNRRSYVTLIYDSDWTQSALIVNASY